MGRATNSDVLLGMSSHHPVYTAGVLVAVGGVAGYVRRRSLPSLVAGILFGAAYGFAGFVDLEVDDFLADFR